MAGAATPRRAWLGKSGMMQDDDDPSLDEPPRDAPRPATARGTPAALALRAMQAALIKEIDGSVNKLERARIGESTREHLRDPAQPAQERR